jgi:hypothetical protein
VTATLVAVALSYRLGWTAASLAGYWDALADVEQTDQPVGWLREMRVTDLRRRPSYQ